MTGTTSNCRPRLPLCFPGPKGKVSNSPSRVGNSYYRVQRGDICQKVVDKFKVSLQDL